MIVVTVILILTIGTFGVFLMALFVQLAWLTWRLAKKERAAGNIHQANASVLCCLSCLAFMFIILTSTASALLTHWHPEPTRTEAR